MFRCFGGRAGRWRCFRLNQVAKRPVKVGQDGGIIVGGGRGAVRVIAAGQVREVMGDRQQPGQAIQRHHVVRAAAGIYFQRLAANLQPRFPGGQLPVNRALRVGMGQGGQIVRGRDFRRRPIDLVQSRFPDGHPAAIFLAPKALVFHGHRIEEIRGQTGEPLVAADGATEGDEGLTEVIGRAPADADRVAIRSANGGSGPYKASALAIVNWRRDIRASISTSGLCIRAKLDQPAPKYGSPHLPTFAPRCPLPCASLDSGDINHAGVRLPVP